MAMDEILEGSNQPGKPRLPRGASGRLDDNRNGNSGSDSLETGSHNLSAEEASEGSIDNNMIQNNGRRRPRPQREALDPAKRVCIWPRVNMTLHRFWKTLEEDVESYYRDKILKIQRVMQRFDKRIRFDVYFDSMETEDIQWLLSLAQYNKWYSKIHAHFHERSRDERHAREPVDNCVTLRIASWNISTIAGKRHDLQNFLRYENVQILGLQETQRKLDGGWPLRLRGYSVYESPMTEGPGQRGIAVVVSSDVPSFEIGAPSPYYVAVQCSIGDQDWIVVSSYLPTAGSAGGGRKLALDQTKELFRGIFQRNVNAHVLVLSDSNINMEKYDRLLLRWQIPMGRVKISGSPMTFHRLHQGQLRTSAIDHLACSQAGENCVSCGRVNRKWDLSDHWPVIVTVRGHTLVNADDAPSPRVIPFYKPKMLLASKAQVLTHTCWDILRDEMDDFDGDADAYEALGAKFENAVKTVASEVNAVDMSRGGSSKKGHQYRLTVQARRAIIRRRKAYTAWCNQPSPNINDALWQTYLELKIHARELKKESIDKSWTSFIRLGSSHLVTNDMSEFWKWANKISGRKVKSTVSTPLYHEGASGNLLYRPKEKLDALQDYYTKLFGDADGTSGNEDYWREQYSHLPEEVELPGMNDAISWEEINNVLRIMKRHKAPGVDGIPGEFYKLAYEDPSGDNFSSASAQSPLGKVLHRLCQVLMDCDSIQHSDNVSQLVLIFKGKGDPRDMGNYRPISLIKVFLKIVTKVLIRRVHQGLEDKAWFVTAQAGFRRLEEANAHTCALYEIAARRHLSNKRTYIAFLDIRKAYDTVPHEALLRKMFLCGVRGPTYAFFRKLYANATVRIRTTDGVTEPVPLRRGVRQGCPASPDEFNIFINDILTGSKGCGVYVSNVAEEIVGLLFADDLALFAPTVKMMKKSLRSVQRWALQNGMSFNVDKCGVMGISKKDEPSDAAQNRLKESGISVGDAPLPVVDTYVYLGLPFHYSLSLKGIITNRVEKGSKAVAALQPVLQTTSIPLSIRVRLVKAIIVPTLTYGVELWGFPKDSMQSPQRVLDLALRLLMGVRRNSTLVSAKAISMELGFEPLAVTGIVARVRAWSKYRALRTVISPLILAIPLKLSVKSWVVQTYRLVRRYCGVDWMERLPSLVSEVRAKLIEAHNSSKEISFQRYQSDDFTSSRQYLRKSLSTSAAARAVHILARWRLGMVWTSAKLAAIHYLPDEWTLRCPMCRIRVSETMYHILFQCSRWGSIRELHLGTELRKLHKFGMAFRTALLLGGSREEVRRRRLVKKWLREWIGIPVPSPTAQNDYDEPQGNDATPVVEVPIFYKVAMFLEHVQRERIKILSPLIKSSIRTNANDPSGSGRVQLINAGAWAAGGD